MFVTNKLIYIQMQKTGCTHIAKILEQLFDGTQIGKHNAANKELLIGRLPISSIRNPWDWYLSLWTFGAGGTGDLYRRLTNKDYNLSIKSALKSPKKTISNFRKEHAKDIQMWKDCYREANDAEAFRAWVEAMNNPKNSSSIGRGYGETNIHPFCGFMTYRFLILTCLNRELLDKQGLISDIDQLSLFESENTYVDQFVRQESLEDSLIAILSKVHKLSEQEIDYINSQKKTNTSKRLLSISEYYDQKTIDIVAQREHVIVDKFGYSFPGT